jgi:biotin operon repressor
MTDPFLENCGGWTPAPDELTRNKRYGFEGSYLWGRLRRLCQLGKGTYTISHEALGERVGMSRRTVIKYLDRLIEDGYVEDLDSGVKNRAHTYSVKKGEDKILSGMQISHTESDSPPQEPELDTDVGMRILHSDNAEIAHQDDVGMQKLHTRYAEIAQEGMQNLHLNRESLETPLRDKDTPNGVGEAPLPEKGVKPKTIIKDRFLELSHLQMPNLKRDSGYWWAQFGEILKLARGDPALACKWQTETIGYMQANHLTITGPQSILGMIRALASGQSLQQPKGQTNGIHSKHNTQRNTDPDRIPSIDLYADGWEPPPRLS